MKAIYEAMGFSPSGMSQTEAFKACVRELKRLVEDSNIPSTLQEFSIPKEAIQSLTDDAILQTRILARSPLKLELEDIFTIYAAAYEGKVVEKGEK